MVSSDVEITNDILLGIAQKIINNLNAEELDFIAVKGEILEGGKVKNTIIFTGDYTGDLTEGSELKTGDKIKINLQSGE